jgi:hypothetical protein
VGFIGPRTSSRKRQSSRPAYLLQPSNEPGGVGRPPPPHRGVVKVGAGGVLAQRVLSAQSLLRGPRRPAEPSPVTLSICKAGAFRARRCARPQLLSCSSSRAACTTGLTPLILSSSPLVLSGSELGSCWTFRASASSFADLPRPIRALFALKLAVLNQTLARAADRPEAQRRETLQIRVLAGRGRPPQGLRTPYSAPEIWRPRPVGRFASLTRSRS